MFILLSSLLAFSETKEEAFIEKINRGITTLSNYCQLRFDVEAEKKWDTAIKITGIDFSKFSTYSGKA